MEQFSGVSGAFQRLRSCGACPVGFPDGRGDVVGPPQVSSAVDFAFTRCALVALPEECVSPALTNTRDISPPAFVTLKTGFVRSGDDTAQWGMRHPSLGSPHSHINAWPI
jgi:hypothetical protein